MQDTLVAREILTPRSIQRCSIHDKMIGFAHMDPSYVFGAGYQREALRQLIERGVTYYKTSIPIGRSGGASTAVHLFAEPDFDVNGYRVYLECMARGTLPLDASTDFEYAVVGPNTATKIWFDFTTKVKGKHDCARNAVFWTLSRQAADELGQALRKLAD